MNSSRREGAFGGTNVSVMRDLPFTALLLVLNYVAADLESTLTTDGSGVSRVWLASYRLPDIDYKHPPEGCDNFDDICHLEKEGKLGLAIKSYEDRLGGGCLATCVSNTLIERRPAALMQSFSFPEILCALLPNI